MSKWNIPKGAGGKRKNCETITLNSKLPIPPAFFLVAIDTDSPILEFGTKIKQISKQINKDRQTTGALSGASYHHHLIVCGSFGNFKLQPPMTNHLYNMTQHPSTINCCFTSSQFFASSRLERV